MSAPAVSIVLPVRDGETTLGACLRSIGRQRFTDWECLIVDDGSSDGSVRLANEVATRDARFRVMPTPPRGIVAALNTGVAAARGTFVARMDADDLMHRDRLSVQVGALVADASLAAVGSHVRVFPRSALTAGGRAYETWLNTHDHQGSVRRDAFVECPVAHPTLLIRRVVLQETGYREVDWPEDYDLVLRLLEAGSAIAVVPRRLVAWREHGRRLTRTHPRYGLPRFTACKAHFLVRMFLASHERFALWGYGDTGRLLLGALAPFGRTASWIVDVHPRRIGQRIHGVPVVGLEGLDRVRGCPLVVSVAGARPRAEIRDYLEQRGWVELRDFVVAA